MKQKAPRRAILLVVIITFIIAGSALAINSFVNPGFESGFFGWTPWSGGFFPGGVTTISSLAHTGSNSARMNLNQRCQATGVYQDLLIPDCGEGFDLVLKVWDKSTQVPELGVDYKIFIHPDQETMLNFNPDGTLREFQYMSSIHVTSAWDWTERTCLVKKALTGSVRRLGVRLGSSGQCGDPISPNADIYADDFSFVCIPAGSYLVGEPPFSCVPIAPPPPPPEEEDCVNDRAKSGEQVGKTPQEKANNHASFKKGTCPDENAIEHANPNAPFPTK